MFFSNSVKWWYCFNPQTLPHAQRHFVLLNSLIVSIWKLKLMIYSTCRFFQMKLTWFSSWPKEKRNDCYFIGISLLVVQCIYVMNSANSVPWILEVFYANLFLKNMHFHHNLVGLNFCNVVPFGDEI